MRVQLGVPVRLHAYTCVLQQHPCKWVCVH